MVLYTYTDLCTYSAAVQLYAEVWCICHRFKNWQFNNLASYFSTENTAELTVFWIFSKNSSVGSFNFPVLDSNRYIVLSSMQDTYTYIHIKCRGEVTYSGAYFHSISNSSAAFIEQITNTPIPVFLYTDICWSRKRELFTRETKVETAMSNAMSTAHFRLPLCSDESRTFTVERWLFRRVGN